jgi:F-box and WD-40 domain protein 1/11
MRSLRTSSIASIVEMLNPLLHLDPVQHLPPEITFLSYLNPETLLRCSTLSLAWRNRVLDSPLWKLLFRLEGWNSNFPQVRAFEELEKLKRVSNKQRERKTRPRAVEDMDYDKPSNKKRVRDRQLFGDGPSPDHSIHDKLEPLSIGGSVAGGSSWSDQHGPIEADNSPVKEEDQMEGISFDNALIPSSADTPHEGRTAGPGQNSTLFRTLDMSGTPAAPRPRSSDKLAVSLQTEAKTRRQLERRTLLQLSATTSGPPRRSPHGVRVYDTILREVPCQWE